MPKSATTRHVPPRVKSATTEVGSGVGVPLTYIAGRFISPGPYKGAPLSIVVISPILPGPYDLGKIVVRTAVHVDPETTAVDVRRTRSRRYTRASRCESATSA